MTEWVLFLMMIRADHGRPVPPKQQVAISREASDVRPERKLSPVEREEFRHAVEQMAREATGKLVRDEQSGLFVPETATQVASR